MNPIKLHVSYGESRSNRWEKLYEIELKLRPIHPLLGKPTDQALLELNMETISLPNEEELQVSVSYCPSNQGINIRVMSEGKILLLSVGGFKKQDTSHDPDILFLTPQGIHLSLMVGY